MTTFEQTDFCDPRVFDDPYDLFTWLRGLDHLHKDEANDFYVAARHEDVFHISRDEDTYCSKFGVRPKIAGDMSIITLDGDEHTRQRRLINKGFTPRRVRDLIPHVRELTNQIIDEMAEKGEVDFVEDFAMHVPLIIIAEMLGLDPEQRHHMYKWSDAMMAGDGHVEADDPVLHAAAESFGEYCMMAIELIEKRREDPEDDLISILTQAFDAGDLAKEQKSYQGVSEEELEKMAVNSGGLKDDELLGFLAWRDIKVRYKQTTLGVLWALIQPAVTLAVFTFIFGKLAGMPAGGWAGAVTSAAEPVGAVGARPRACKACSASLTRWRERPTR